MAIVVVVGIAYLSANRHLFLLKNTENTEIQKSIIGRVESITTADDAVLDGVGMLVTRRKATPYSMTRRWDMNRQAGRYRDVLDWIAKTEPKVFINNYRSIRLSSAEREYISDNFLHDWANIWVAGKRISLPAGVHEQRASGGERGICMRL